MLYARRGLIWAWPLCTRSLANMGTAMNDMVLNTGRSIVQGNGDETISKVFNGQFSRALAGRAYVALSLLRALLFITVGEPLIQVGVSCLMWSCATTLPIL